MDEHSTSLFRIRVHKYMGLKGIILARAKQVGILLYRVSRYNLQDISNCHTRNPWSLTMPTAMSARGLLVIVVAAVYTHNCLSPSYHTLRNA